jgi:hypothetical protein
MSEENELIDSWAKSLCERLIEIRFIDLEEMKAALVVHMKSALFDCLKVQISDTRRKLDETKKQYVNHGGGKNNHIQSEIISLKQRLKQENKFLAHLDRENQGRELVLWMRKYHEQSLLDFYKYYDTVSGIDRKRPNIKNNQTKTI